MARVRNQLAPGFVEFAGWFSFELPTGGLDLSVGLQQLLVLALELIDLVLELLDYFLLPLAFSFFVRLDAPNLLLDLPDIRSVGAIGSPNPSRPATINNAAQNRAEDLSRIIHPTPHVFTHHTRRG